MEALINIEELKKHESLYQAFQANAEAIEEIDSQTEGLEKQKIEVGQKIYLAKELGLSIKSMNRTIKKIDREIKTFTKMRTAYASGYLEIPELQNFRDVQEIKTGEEANPWYHFHPTAETPLRVFEAIKKAKEMGIFDTLVVFKKFRKPDPIIAGKIKDRYFYLASYR